MAMVFERIQTAGIAQLSYVIGDQGSQSVAVFDPIPSIEMYLELSRKYGVTITHIFETHIHADFMSGARELKQRLGFAKIFVSGETNPVYDFQVQKVHDGDRFEFGTVLLTARHTPGHTPEHLSYELAELERADKPWGVLSGDSLFVGSAGRPDLLGAKETEEQARHLYHTLRDYYLKLKDGVIIYPGHGAGSACGANIGERPMSTIGYERQTNDFLQIEDFEEFATFVKEGAPPVPYHYSILKKLNARGPKVIGAAPTVAGLPPEDFQSAFKNEEMQLIDTRHMLAFGGGHVLGAINIGDRPELSVWAGDMLSHETPILLIVADDTPIESILWRFAYVGLTNFAGYLAGGMTAWINKGLELESLPQLSVEQLARQQDTFQILDVRSPAEYERSRIKGAKHKFVAEMRSGIDGTLGLDKHEPVAVYCGSGYRASIAASLMKRAGFTKAHNVPGSMQAWKNAGFKVET
jgi:hydroxyacylglutathione hydrolase